MAAPRELDPASSVLAFFGAELRRLRTQAGVSQEDLAQQIAYSASLVGMIETARQHEILQNAATRHSTPEAHCPGCGRS